MTTTETRAGILADRFAPRYDHMQTKHLVVDAPPEQTYAAVRALDFTDVGGPVVDAAFWVRGLPERYRNRHHVTPRHRTRLTFDDMAAGSDWLILGERTGSEIVIGVAARFWTPVVEWRRVEPDEFADFAEPGYGKIVLSLSVRPYGQGRALLTSDTRVICTDRASRAKVRAYWRVAGPFIGLVQAATLRTIAQHAEHPTA